jgi:hypothetical protein
VVGGSVPPKYDVDLDGLTTSNDVNVVKSASGTEVK